MITSTSNPASNQNAVLTAENSAPPGLEIGFVQNGMAGSGAHASKPTAASTQTQAPFAAVLKDKLKAAATGKGTASVHAATIPTKTSIQAGEKAATAAAHDKKADDDTDQALISMLAPGITLPQADNKSSTKLPGNDLSEPLQTPVAQPAKIAADSPGIVALPPTISPPMIPSPVAQLPGTTELAKPAAKNETNLMSAAPSMPATTSGTGKESAAIIAATTNPADQLPEKPVQEAAEGVSFPDMLRATQSHVVANMAQVQQSQVVANIPAARSVQTPMASSQWVNDVGNQLTWMVGQHESKADLVLNPPQLGRIEVSLSIDGNQATASFVSANPDVRDALQGSLPRLREILADTGVFLGQASIGAESFQQPGNNPEKGSKSADDSFSSRERSLIGSLNAPSSSWIGQGKGLVDLFA